MRWNGYVVRYVHTLLGESNRSEIYSCSRSYYYYCCCYCYCYYYKRGLVAFLRYVRAEEIANIMALYYKDESIFYKMAIIANMIPMYIFLVPFPSLPLFSEDAEQELNRARPHFQYKKRKHWKSMPRARL